MSAQKQVFDSPGQRTMATTARTSHPSYVVLTVVITLALYGILGYALSRRPPETISGATARILPTVPHVIAVVNASALGCLLLGWRAIRAGRVKIHRRYMLAASALILTFLILYVSRVALGGVKHFGGPAAMRLFVYLPVLAVHITLSILSVPLVVYNLLIGLTFEVRNIPRSPHPRVGRAAVFLWSVSLFLGIIVYALLNLIYPSGST